MSFIPPLELVASTPMPPSGGWPPASRGAPPEDPLLPLPLLVPIAPEFEADPEGPLLLPEAPSELLDGPPLMLFPTAPDPAPAPPPSAPLLVQGFVEELPPEHAAKAALAVRSSDTRQRTRSG